jgi:hypothetical protein
VTTSNKPDPTTSSILLAKRLTFPSALDFPVNLNNPNNPKPTTPPGPTNKNRVHGKEAPYWEPRRFVRTIMAKEPSGVSSSSLSSQNFGGVPHPPALLS